jgi:hypothetical protein
MKENTFPDEISLLGPSHKENMAPVIDEISFSPHSWAYS